MGCQEAAPAVGEAAEFGAGGGEELRRVGLVRDLVHGREMVEHRAAGGVHLGG